ncbi:hypothetical protein BC939DRAFT_129829 [Gamsiella multidivaricata]|uniref:uncharacterized protein n=1 Tax=Gamsiella multidivaricata TaxID=101098 RepID=UPI0022207C2E|nr:uncharacterized protein BC939DRAFT_129829 [Gamsiella multidivaricata]KAI7825398.1 hypothetical protein BC939DRAFT_129829 [Gamsiella multidivaricata]
MLLKNTKNAVNGQKPSTCTSRLLVIYSLPPVSVSSSFFFSFLLNTRPKKKKKKTLTDPWTFLLRGILIVLDQFLLATHDTQNQEVSRTLKLMNANHIRQGKDLQRRIAKAAAVAEAAAAAAAALSIPPQKQSGVARTKGDGSHHPTSSATASTGTGASGSGSGTGSGSGGTNSGRRRRESGDSGHQQGNTGGLGQRHINLRNKSGLGDLDLGEKEKEEDGEHITTSEPSSNSSSAIIEESFTLIKNHVKDDSDPFNKFWDAVENLVLKISSPVAFTSIPLDGDDPMLLNSPSSEDPPPSPFTPMDGLYANQNDPTRAPLPQTLIANQAQSRSSKLRGVDPSSMHESFFIIDAPSVANSQIRGHSRVRSDSGSSSGSVVTGRPGSSSSSSSAQRKAEIATRSPSKTLEEYAIENQQLKITLDKLSRRNLKLEKNLEGVMQMSVWQKDLQRSAMQLIRSQDVLRPVKQSIQDLSAEKGNAMAQKLQAVVVAAAAATSNTVPSMSIGTPMPGSTLPGAQTNSNPATMQTRLLELEEENLKLKLENSKLNSLMKKYKQRWEDLKESAKKRRNATQDGMGESSSNSSSSSGNSNNNNNNNIPGVDARPSLSSASSSSQRPLLQASSSSPSTTTNSNPYSVSSLAGNPHGGGSHSSVPIRPMPQLARSSSASGPVVLGGGSYQRRILMENRNGGLDSTPMNMHRHVGSGIVSVTSPRVLDTSPRTNMSGGILAVVPEVQKAMMVASPSPPPPPPAGISPQPNTSGSNALLSDPAVKINAVSPSTSTLISTPTSSSSSSSSSSSLSSLASASVSASPRPNPGT